MRAPSSAWPRAVAAAALMAAAATAPAADWFLSDGSGAALEAASKARALRSDWGLSREELAGADLPESTDFPAPGPGFSEASSVEGARVELRMLYEKGLPRDRLIAVRAGGRLLYEEKVSDEGRREAAAYGPDGSLSREERLAADGSLIAVAYEYSGGAPVKATATDQEGVELWSDLYAYTRTGSLASVSRVASGGPAGGARFSTSVGVPRRVETVAASGSSRVAAYDSSGRLVLSFGRDAAGSAEGPTETVEYVEGRSVATSMDAAGIALRTEKDEAGRVLATEKLDAEGRSLERVENAWFEGKIAATVVRAPGKELRSEFDYDDEGRRTAVREYKDGALERTVSIEGDREVEELYRGGKPVLRTVRVAGRRVSETRLSPKDAR